MSNWIATFFSVFHIFSFLLLKLKKCFFWVLENKRFGNSSMFNNNRKNEESEIDSEKSLNRMEAYSLMRFYVDLILHCVVIYVTIVFLLVWHAFMWFDLFVFLLGLAIRKEAILPLKNFVGFRNENVILIFMVFRLFRWFFLVTILVGHSDMMSNNGDTVGALWCFIERTILISGSNPMVGNLEIPRLPTPPYERGWTS